MGTTAHQPRTEWTLVVGLLLAAVSACGTSEEMTGPAMGTIEVTAATTGEDPDPDGYTLGLDGSDGRAIDPNGTVTFTELDPGDYELALSGVADNCAVAGANPRTVTVTDGATAATTFEVSCSRITGSIEVTAVTTGEDPDPDGYTLGLDGSDDQAIDPNGTVTFTEIEPGDHELALSGIADNCAAAGANPRTVTVAGGATAATTFEVSCEQITGDIEVIAATTGEDPDPDGYTVTLDSSDDRAIDPDGTVTFTEIEPGDHELALSGVADNCAAAGANPRTVTVVGDETATTTFDVGCERIDRIAFESDRSGDLDIWVMEADGSNVINLTGAPDRQEFTAAWSPDGTRIAFEAFEGAGNEDIWAMDADGSNLTNLTDHPSTRDTNAHWSPDGTRIAFRRAGEIWVMDPDGSNAMNLTGGLLGREPHWSPDGTRLLFRSFDSGNSDIWVIDADGSNATNLTEHPDDDHLARWSPDGTRIVFSRLPDGFGSVRDLWVMDADGSNATRLTNSPAHDLDARWSPDGTRIAFRRNLGTDHDLWVMGSDGSNPMNLTDSLCSVGAFDARWSPDGTRIAFRCRTTANSEIWVMGADGSNPTNLTNHSAHDAGHAWQP